MSEQALRLDGVTVRFGGLTAVNELDLTLAPGELVGVIGPNGAGKTTVFNVITGVCRPGEGTVSLQGEAISGMPVHEIATRGLARTFQNIRLFHGMTVFDNVRVACHREVPKGLLHALLRTPTWSSGERAACARADQLLGVMGLSARRAAPANSLSYGEQRRLEIARALALSPKILLLDEPAAGMNPTEKTELIALIKRIHSEFGLSILLVEHSMHVVMSLCSRIAVLDYGRKIAEGSPEQIRANPAVIEAYLGEGAAQS